MKELNTEANLLIPKSRNGDYDNQIDIKTVFAQHMLERIQKSVADVTDIAFVTVDYKGDVITEQTHFCQYCQSIRNDTKSALLCRLSDASGAIIAATNKEASIYVCPYGLLEIAIPIIVNDQYLGGFIGGQILCHDIPDSVVRLSKNMIPSGTECVKLHVNELSAEELIGFKEYSYKEVVSIARLVELIINQLTSQALISSRNKQKNLQRIVELEQKVKELSLVKNMIDEELEIYKRRTNMILDRNMLNVISNLCILEDAPRTYNALLNYIQIIGAKANYLDSSTIKDEFERVESFIHLTNERTNGRIHCHTQIDNDVIHKLIPMYVLLQYIQAIVYFFLDTEEQELNISIQATNENEQICIIIKDNGTILKTKDIEWLNSPNSKKEAISRSIVNIFDASQVVNSLLDIRKALYDQYQESYLLDITRVDKRGLQITIEYPAIYGEDVHYD